MDVRNDRDIPGKQTQFLRVLFGTGGIEDLIGHIVDEQVQCDGVGMRVSIRLARVQAAQEEIGKSAVAAAVLQSFLGCFVAAAGGKGENVRTRTDLALKIVVQAGAEIPDSGRMADIQKNHHAARMAAAGIQQFEQTLHRNRGRGKLLQIALRGEQIRLVRFSLDYPGAGHKQHHGVFGRRLANKKIHQAVLDGAYSGVAIDQPLELQVVYQFPASRQVQVVAETERIGGCELQL